MGFLISLTCSFKPFSKSVETPIGLIAHMFGPIEGRRHNAFILAESGLQEKLVHMEINGDPYVVYGDPAPFREA